MHVIKLPGTNLRFCVYNNGALAKDFELTGAYIFGADTIPLHASTRLTCSDGVIECKRKSNDSAGLSLLWPVEGFGRILLATTRLPDRKEPYNLNIELARAKLMQIALFTPLNGYLPEFVFAL